MILDTLENASLYENLVPGFAAAFDWLRRHGGEATGAPVEIDGERVVARPSEYETHPRSPGKFECHRRYIDIQFVAKGEEVVEVEAPGKLVPAVPYDEAKDVAWFSSDEPRTALPLGAGSFLVLWPHEAHQPGISPAAGALHVRKVIVKVAVNA